MKVFLVVHGIVQGVGYRRYVLGIAQKYKIKGYVVNAGDGSVQVFADAPKEDIEKFIKELHIDTKYGVRVFGIDKHYENEIGFPKEIRYNKDAFEMRYTDGD